MTRRLRVATVQFQHRAGDKHYNLGRIEHFAQAACDAGVQVACFPEMCVSGYWHVPSVDREELYALAEPVNGPSVSRAAELAHDLGIGTFSITGEGSGLALSLKEGASESLYASGPDTFFILSTDMVLHVTSNATPVSGRLVTGPFDVSFQKEG